MLLLVACGSPSAGTALTPTPARSTATGEGVWQRQAEILGTAVQMLTLADGSSPAEPRTSAPPSNGRFVARILAADPARGTVTVNRIQLFSGADARQAAAADGAAEPPSGVYWRDRIHERTVLRLSRDVAITRFFPPPGQPATGLPDTVAITALTPPQFFTDYAHDKGFRRLLRSGGAWIVVWQGKIVVIAANYLP